MECRTASNVILVRNILEENADISEGLVVSQFQSILAELENTKITQNPPATDLEGVLENSKQEVSLETEISIRDSENPKIKSKFLIPTDLKHSLHLLLDICIWFKTLIYRLFLPEIW